MRNKIVPVVLFAVSFCIIGQSCNKEPLKTDTTSANANRLNPIADNKVTSISKAKLPDAKLLAKAATLFKVDNLQSEFIKKMVAAHAPGAVATAGDCVTTEFSKLTTKYASQFGELEFNLYGLYTTINYLSLYLDNSKQYFGANGEETHLVTKDQRKLASFWNMPNEVQIRGEHNSTLDNRDKIADVYIVFAGLSQEDAYAVADQIIAINKQSPVFIETPLLSFDGFSTANDPTFGNFIVLGDGLVQVLSQASGDEDIVVTEILAHEWGHQVQFNHSNAWFGVDVADWPYTADFTQYTELQADFFAGYFLTHKRGATYNWKRVAQFLNVSYNEGDCYFDEPSHHGTPNQRLASARLGYFIADETLPKGHILSADQLNSFYQAAYNSILTNTISTQQALASLKNAELKAIYKNVLQYKNQLRAIANGALSKTKVENLQ